MTPRFLLTAATLTALAGCVSTPDPAELQARFQALMQGSFRDEGIARTDRLAQDADQAACSTGEPLPPARARAIEAAALATVRPPADGQYLGDWREGEKLAQSGRGMTWTDKSTSPAGNGGSCYNCHQLSPTEISYGTIGPSLYQFGLRRGVQDPRDPSAQAVVQYAWGKLNNAWAYQACSNMPRFGHRQLLDEQQLKHLMALLLDPASPVNAR